MSDYSVYIFLESPYTTANPPPISKIFEGGNFKNIYYFNHPNINIAQDTRVGIHCGRNNCGGCNETFKMRAVSSDYLIFKSVINHRANNNLSGGVIIVKPSTIALTGDSTTISTILNEAATETNNEFDIFYLSKWLDRPEKYVTIKSYPTGGKMIRTYSPNGLQAFALSVNGINKLIDKYSPDKNPVLCRPFSQVINMLVENGTLYAVSTTPTLMFYDASRIVLKTTNASIGEKARFSYLKTCEARGEIHPEEPLNRRISADLSFFWLFMILVIIILTVSVVYCNNSGKCNFK